MEIQVKTEHFKESTGYTSTTNCPLAVACKDQLPYGTSISVGGSTVLINHQRYIIGENWRLLECHTIDEMIQDAENGKEIQTITVELTQM